MEKQWEVLAVDDGQAASLQRALGINKTLCNILVQRGISDYESAKDYFRPHSGMLHSPWLMKDMRKAVDRISLAMESKEKILVFGDYDVDGTTAVALTYQFLADIYTPDLVDFYIPHRYREGYGVSLAGIEFAAAHGITLIVCLDCGIKSTALIAHAKTIGIDFIVCDHHLPGETLPEAVAILNSKQPGCDYPFKELCGCGVGFKLISALAEQLNISSDRVYRYLDLVAVAIAADIVPMTGENRVLSSLGLERINADPSPGLKALIKLGGLQATVDISDVVFVIAPRVNAAGRMDDATKAVQLFIEHDQEKALALAELLHTHNTDRREADSSITAEALEIIRGSDELLSQKTSVVYREHWHKGVVGIVASRLIEHFYRPTIVLTRNGDIVAGSARSVPGFNLYEAIYACRDHLITYGGHFAAAGVSMKPENVAGFTKRFNEVVTASIEERLLVPVITIDSEISFPELRTSLYNIILQMEPFGPGNLRPVFIASGVSDTGFSRIVKEQHIKFVLKQGEYTITGIGFNLAHKFPLLQLNQAVDIVFTLDENEWQGEKSLQLKVIDFRLQSVSY